MIRDQRAENPQVEILMEIPALLEIICHIVSAILSFQNLMSDPRSAPYKTTKCKFS